MKHTIVQIVKIDDTGDSCYRMRWPAQSYGKAHPESCIVNLDALSPDRYAFARDADLLVLFQSLDPDMLQVIEERRVRGLKTLVEYNDNFYSPQAWSPVAKEWNSHRVWDVYERFMQIADGVIVTGQGLYDLFSSVTPKPIHIIENYLPEAPHNLEVYKGRKTPYPSFGWAGSLGHMADLLGSLPIIREVLEAVPESKFHVMGNDSIPQHLRLSPERLVFTPWGTMEQYYAFWESLHAGFAPLLDTPYNRCRSDIKAVEMSSRGVAPILCNALPYQDFLRTTGIEPVRNFKESVRAITDILVDSDKRLRYVKSCYDYVTTKRVDTGEGKRAALYRSLLPQSPQAASISLAPGYHEIVGKQDAEPPSSQLLRAAQNLLKEKRGKEALDSITRAASEAPHAIELVTAALQLMRAAQHPEFHAQMLSARERFPHEPRIWILYIQSGRGDEHRERWRELFAWLRTKTPQFVRSVGPEIIHAMSLSLTQDYTLAETGEELLLFYPFAYQIRFQVADALERAGRLWESRAHFETLCRAKKEYELGGQALANLDRGYLEAWYESVDARIKGDFS